ncbi:beta-ketoacyl synthase N-terminal-like domain-containing protein [Sorangium sp. So ce375]|uniref:type I polyketide synthase n=1 Tax=Sorangium sp. So ce375 TaxID=3133306 RepID=UPI003F5BCEDC
MGIDDDNQALPADPADGIAIVGMACRLPGAARIEDLWSNLCAGVESITRLSDEALLASGVDPALLSDARYVKARAVLSDVERFDPGFFGMSPREAEITDPQHRIFLECAWEALERAGYDPGRYPGSIGVYAGAGPDGYLVHHLVPAGEAREGIDGLGVVLGNDKDHLTTRVAYKLDLRGPSITVQTACSTSLVAVQMACQALLGFQCDVALAGGVSIQLPLDRGYLHKEGHILSPDGRCRAFAADAQGTVGGDGAGVVALKRLADALADGDAIHAVIRGAAVNNDGSQKAGYTAPSVQGQAEVVAMALAFAGVSARSIGYVEAHGTGTRLGDPIEIAALTQAFRASTPDRGFCAIGSLKTNLGHLNNAAGVASLIKAALAVERATLPPSLHCRAPNPAIDFDNSPFYVNTSLRPWPPGDGMRRAGVSSFGFGGTNAHVILEEAPPRPPRPPPARPFALLLLSARSPAALEAASAQLADHIERGAPDAAALADTAYTLQIGRKAFEHRRAVVCRDAAEAAAALRHPAAVRAVVEGAPGAPGRRVVFLFPGQGAQSPGTGAELYRTEPAFRAEVDRCAELLAPHLGRDVREVMFTEDSAPLGRTALAQPALFVLEVALARLWMSWGVRPAAVLGHSLGEYTAACVAGVLSLEDALALVVARGRLMEALPPGAMLAVPLAEDELRPLLSPGLAIAAVNGPTSSVASGPEEEIAALERRLAERGASTRRLAVSRAFHSAMMDPILDAFRAEVGRARLRAPALPCLSNVTGGWLSDAQATDPGYFAAHLRAPVRFAEGLGRVLTPPGAVLLEVGPGRTLSALAAIMAPEATVIAGLPGRGAGAPGAPDPEPAALARTLGALWLAGVEIDWAAVHAMDPRRRRPLPTYPFERRRCWIERPALPAHAAPAGPAPGCSAAAGPRPLAEVEAELRAALAIRPLEDYPGLTASLDALCAAHVGAWLRARGVDVRAGANHEREALAARVGVVPKLRRLHDAMIRMLAEDGIVSIEGASIRFLRDAGALLDTAAESRALAARYPELAGLFELLDHCVRHYPEALTGEIEAIGVLYPSGSAALTDRFEARTAEHRSERVYLALLREVAARVGAGRSGAPLRVLEVGGGRGVLTWPLAAALAASSGARLDYHFTDLGKTFVDDARHEAARRGLASVMSFGVLDIARDPRPQGYEDGRFDLIVAYNVVHAVRDVPAALGHLERLLAPGGTLGLVEGVRLRRWDILTWGLAEGFWYFDDALRGDLPLLGLDRWEEALRGAGLEGVEAYPREPEARARADHGLILGTRPDAVASQRAPVAPADPARAAPAPAASLHPRPALRTPYVAPRDALERQLAAVCEELLGVHPVGIHDDFFELGADSLLMLRISDRVQQELRRAVPQHAIFRGATVERLARALDPDAAIEASSVLVPLQPAGTRPPLFFVHPAAGVVFPYVGLSRALGPDQPFYALQAQGLDAQAPPDERIEDMARRYNDAIRRAQPRGPYHLGGFSFGCLVAFEMAQQLVAAGEEVGLLAIVDEPAPIAGYRPSPLVMGRVLATGIARSIWPHVHDYLYLVDASRRAPAAAPPASGGLALPRLGRREIEAFLARSAMANFVPRESRLLALRQPAMIPMFRLFTMHVQQTLAYTPRAYPRRLTFFRATEIRGRLGRDPTQGWSMLAAGGVDVVPIPGDHLSLLRPPHVDVLAARLAERIDKVSRAGAAAVGGVP